jgi:hypothetical protein
MQKSITVETSKLPGSIRALVSRKTVEVFPLSPDSKVHLGSIQWSEGSRDVYHVVSLDTGAAKRVEDVRPWPSNMGAIGETIVPPRHVIVRTGTFCGKEATPYVYAQAADIVQALPAPAPELTNAQQAVLVALKCFNSVGKERFRLDFNMSRETWDCTILGLAEKGLCTKRGTLTVTGRNAAKQFSDALVNPYSNPLRFN